MYEDPLDKFVSGLTFAATFFSCWVYCWFSYGFLLGFGFGWVPSLIVAWIAFMAWRIIWFAILMIVAVVAISMLRA